MVSFCVVLMLIQFAACVPWLLAWTWNAPSGSGLVPQRIKAPAWALGGCLGVGLLVGLSLSGSRSGEELGMLGQGYGSILSLQLTVDFFVLTFAGLTFAWPKGAAVMRAAFREGHRQPMFWLLVLIATGLMILFPFVPYFTFGEDYIMMKELGFDTIMFVAAAFGVLAAAASISEEIEGRTAVTLMSKPVSRREFLLGKFAGIFLCSALLIAGLGWFFAHVLVYKRWYDKTDPVVLPQGLGPFIEQLNLPPEGQRLMHGQVLWLLNMGEVVPGLMLAGALVMVLVSLAVSLATRLPMIVNLIVCLVVYMLANLAPVLVESTRSADPARAGPVQKLLHFTAQAFDTVLPALELFRVRPTLVDDTTLPMAQYWQHVASVSLYGAMFTAIVLLVGLVLFEDRDLA